MGQHIVRKLVALLGRASLIIFVLALTIFASAISLGELKLSAQSLKYKLAIAFAIEVVKIENVKFMLCVAGGASISDLVIRLHRKEHMGFQDICRPS